MSESKKAKPNKKRRAGRVFKRILKTLLLLILLGAAALFGAKAYIQSQAEKNKSAESYSVGRAILGSMKSTVYGSGTTSARSQPNLLAGADGTLTELCVSVGDSVKKGDILAILMNDELDDSIINDELAIWELDSKIQGTAPGSTVSQVLAPVTGRVMAVYAQKGDNALAVFRREGALALISTDGRMKVSLQSDSSTLGVELGETLLVRNARTDEVGTVTDLTRQGTQAVVTINTDLLTLGDEVTVYKQDGETVVGVGQLEINKPMAVSAYGGTISAVKAKVGERVIRKAPLFTLSDYPLTLTIEDLRLQRETAVQTLASDREKRENLIVLAPCDGVIASIEVKEGDEISEGQLIGSILEGEDMNLTIAVDELDVVNVEIGQSVAISVDALPGLTLAGEVYKIAPIGSNSGGVTTYDVELSFDAEGSGVRSGMNATGEITIAEKESALYVPVEAIRTINNQTFVMVASNAVVPASADVSASAGKTRGSARSGRQSGEAWGAEFGNMPPQGFPEGMGGMPGAGGMPGMGGMPGAEGASNGGSAPSDDQSEADIQRGKNASGAADASSAKQERFSIREYAEKAVDFVKAWLYEGVQTQNTQMTGELVRVEVGLRNDDYAEIVSGLSEGDVILYSATSTSSTNGWGGNRGGMGGMMMGF